MVSDGEYHASQPRNLTSAEPLSLEYRCRCMAVTAIPPILSVRPSHPSLFDMVPFHAILRLTSSHLSNLSAHL